MNIVFVEVQPWEKPLLTSHFPEAMITDAPLTDEHIAEYANAEILSCFIYSQITKKLLDKLPHLKYITTRSTGFDNIDLAACKQRNIVVSNVPEYGSNTVAEFTFALLLDVTRKVTQSIRQAKQLQFDHQALQGVDIYGKTIGVIGLGKIGKNVVKIARGFGMHVLAYNRSQDKELEQALGFTYMDLEALLKSSDIVTVHVPLTDETKHIINTTNILNFKKGSYLINTARGGLIDAQAIVLGLEKEILAGVGLDVLEGESEFSEEAEILHAQNHNVQQLTTLLYDHVLLNHPKVLITPHNAFNSREALMRILIVTIENIDMYLDNKQQHSVMV